MKFENTVRNALIGIGIFEETLDKIEERDALLGEDERSLSLVERLNTFLSPLRGGKIEINHKIDYSLYKDGVIYIAPHVINAFVGDLQYKAVGALAHEVAHALSKIETNHHSFATSVSSQHRKEGEALYYEILALHNIDPNIKNCTKLFWEDNESDAESINIYDELYSIASGSGSILDKIEECAKIGKELVFGYFGESSVRITYDEFYKWDWLKQNTDIAVDYMEAWGKTYTRDLAGRIAAYTEMESLGNADLYGYDIKILVNQAHKYFGTDDINEETLEAEPGGSALGRDRGIEILWGGEGPDKLHGRDGASNTLLGGGGNDYLYGKGGSDILAGNTGNDELYGSAGEDRLYGGEGDDFLYGGDEGKDDYVTGGQYKDELAGGDGFDTYYAGRGDTIKDSDGNGEVYYNFEKLDGGKRKEDAEKDENGFYTYKGNGVTYKWDGVDGSTLYINGGADEDGITIEKFKNGDLEIDLDVKDDDDDGNGGNGQGNGQADDIESKFVQGQQNASPLVLDLDGDGVTTTSLKDGIYFDHDGNGFAGKTAWVGQGDGVLVFDINHNGKIDNGSELFGNNTKLPDGSLAPNGFEALAQFDANGDGIIDNNDDIFSILRVWVDANQDGVSQPNELFTLAELGIAGIYTGYKNSTQKDEHGNAHLQQGSFIWADGKTGQVNDVWFVVDNKHNKELNKVEVSAEIAGLPDIMSNGNVHSLHQAMAQDTTGKLQGLIDQFIGETNASAREALLDEIVFTWTGAGQYASDSRGGNIDGRILYALEAFLARDFKQNGYNSNPGPNASNDLREAYAHLKNYVNATLLRQSHLKFYMDLIEQDVALYEEAGDDSGQLKFSSFVAALKVVCAGDRELAMQLAKDMGYVVRFGSINKEAGAFMAENLNRTLGLSGDAALVEFGRIFNLFTFIDHQLFGTGGQDTLRGTQYNDYLKGEAGNDSLYGNAGDDGLEGGAGNDYLNGGIGNDVYYFEQGWGQDKIYDSSGSNQIRFGIGITLENLAFSRNLTSLFITRVDEQGNPTGDAIEVSNFFNTDGSLAFGAIESIVFQDGSFLGKNSLVQFVRSEVTNGNDTLYLDETDNDINALGGNDVIYAMSGDDVVHGGAGNDVIHGGYGNDQLWGDEGDDVLQGDYGDDTLNGGKGNDTLDGGVGNDILIGGEGNDYLRGGIDSDIYVFGRNFGQDTINNYGAWYGYAPDKNDHDVIQFTEGWKASDFTYQRSGRDLIIAAKESADSIVVSQYFDKEATDGYEVDLIIFDDGTKLTVEDIKELVLLGTKGDDTLFAYNNGGILNGLEGNDWLYGASGEDTLFGGQGDDYLYGAADNDLLQGDGGNDELHGGNGDDILIGGAGNDYLNGGEGADTYVFGRNFGQDTIMNYDVDEGKDVIRFVDGWKASDFIFERSDYHLVIKAKEGTDQIVVTNYFAQTTTGYQMDLITFEDGTKLTIEDVKRLSQMGTDGDDALYGGDGNDTLIGGAGNDYLNGGKGSDTYVFGRNFGQDTIENYDTTIGREDVISFIEGWRVSDFTFQKVMTKSTIHGTKYDLVITAKETTDSIVIKDYFLNDGTGNGFIDLITFEDGTRLTLDNIKDLILIGTDASDQLYADDAGRALYGMNGNDSLRGGAGDDYLDGGIGDDSLSGGDGNDYLIGGAGNDRLNGGLGSDTYHFEQNWGQDTIRYSTYDNDYSTANDVVSFGEGIYASDLMLFKNIKTDDLIIQLKNGTDQIIIEDYFYNTQRPIDEVRFADGTVWTGNDILQLAVNAMIGTENRDTLYGSSGNDYIYGGAGNDGIGGAEGDDFLYGEDGSDHLNGGEGNDFLVGGAGNDWLDGEEGTDTYYFERGWGQDNISNYDEDIANKDVILFGDGIGADDIELSRYENDLLVRLKGTQDQITVSNFYSQWNEPHTNIDEIQFADGTRWTSEQIRQMVVPYKGTDGDDYIIAGWSGDGHYIGGAGDDYISGGDGNDTYYFERGWGQDTVAECGGQDKFVFGEGITIDQLWFSHKPGYMMDSLLITLIGTGDSIEITSWENQYYDTRVELFETSDGKTLSYKQVDALVQAMAKLTPPAMGQTSLTLEQRAALESVLAACWKDPNANAAPIVSGSIANQQGKTGQNFSYTLPENLFSDPDGDALTYSVTLADGSSLPSWLTFNAATRTLSGIPANESIGTLNFKVIATDPGGLSASQDLQLKVEPAKTYNTITGTNSKNTLKGTTKDDHIMGLGGNDTINAGAGDDLLEGGDGTDTLNGEAGHDMLVGGAGNDTLNGGAGNDTYIFDKGWGQDKVTDNDATKGNLDKFIFGEGISSDQLWFKKNGTGLDVMLIGTTDKITITSWYSGSRYQIEQFQTSDGKTLSNTKIDALVSAMAGFAVPAAGQTSLTPQMQAALQPVIAASWQ